MFKRLFLCFLWLFQSFCPYIVQAAPAPASIHNSIEFKGIAVNPSNPFAFDMIVEPFSGTLSNDKVRQQSLILAKYFLGSLAIPSKDMWVNLSPYEKDRIVPSVLGQTVLGLDMLSQDYELKQISAQLLNPDTPTGKEFWMKARAKAKALYGVEELPLNTFNKVWIVPDKATVYERKADQGIEAFIVERHLKVMLDRDYEALANNSQVTTGPVPAAPYKSSELGKLAPAVYRAPASGPPVDRDGISQEIMREVIVPILEEEINHGQKFSVLRQIYDAMILSTWYKRKLKDTALAQVYMNKNKVRGVDSKNSKEAVNKVYQNYVNSFKKGVFNFIKEEANSQGELIPRKYFSGGIEPVTDKGLRIVKELSPDQQYQMPGSKAMIVGIGGKAFDRAMMNDPNDVLRNTLIGLGAFDMRERRLAAAEILTIRGVSSRTIINALSGNLINPAIPDTPLPNTNWQQYRINARLATLWAMKDYVRFNPKSAEIIKEILQEEVNNFKTDASRTIERMGHEAQPSDSLLLNFWLIRQLDKQLPYWAAPDIKEFIYPDLGKNDPVSEILYHDQAMVPAQFDDIRFSQPSKSGQLTTPQQLRNIIKQFDSIIDFFNKYRGVEFVALDDWGKSDALYKELLKNLPDELAELIHDQFNFMYSELYRGHGKGAPRTHRHPMLFLEAITIVLLDVANSSQGDDVQMLRQLWGKMIEAYNASYDAFNHAPSTSYLGETLFAQMDPVMVLMVALAYITPEDQIDILKRLSNNCYNVLSYSDQVNMSIVSLIFMGIHFSNNYNFEDEVDFYFVDQDLRIAKEALTRNDVTENQKRMLRLGLANVLRAFAERYEGKFSIFKSKLLESFKDLPDGLTIEGLLNELQDYELGNVDSNGQKVSTPVVVKYKMGEINFLFNSVTAGLGNPSEKLLGNPMQHGPSTVFLQFYDSDSQQAFGRFMQKLHKDALLHYEFSGRHNDWNDKTHIKAVFKHAIELFQNPAMVAPGGIDLDENKLNLTVQGESSFGLDKAMAIDPTQEIQGLTPYIVHIEPYLNPATASLTSPQ